MTPAILYLYFRSIGNSQSVFIDLCGAVGRLSALDSTALVSVLTPSVDMPKLVAAGHSGTVTTDTAFSVLVGLGYGPAIVAEAAESAFEQGESLVDCVAVTDAPLIVATGRRSLLTPIGRLPVASAVGIPHEVCA